MPSTNFEFTGNNAQLLKTIHEIEQEMSLLENEATDAGVSLDTAFARVKSGAMQLAGVAGLATGGMSLLTKVVGTRSDFQNTEAMFKVFLKDGEKAKDFMDEIQKYAYNNVFDFQDLTHASSQLMAYGVEADKVLDKVDQLSEVAAGTNTSLGELVASYTRVKATDTIDSRMEQSLSAKGIRVRALLAESRGKTEKEMEGVKLHFKDLDEVLQKVTGEGGMYSGMMAEKMKTLGDSVGLLQDSVTQMFNDMGKEVQYPLREMIYGAADVVKNWREVIKILGGVATAYGVIKAAQKLDKAFNNAEKVYALNNEKEALSQLAEMYKEQGVQTLKQEVADLSAAEAKGVLTAAELAELEMKKKLLAVAEEKPMDDDLQAAVDKGVLTEARAREIQKIREETDELIKKAKVEKQSTENELVDIKDRINKKQEEIDKLKEQIELIEEAKKEQGGGIKVSVEGADGMVDTKIIDGQIESEKLLNAQKEMESLLNEQNAKSEKLSNLQKQISTGENVKNTITLESNNKAKKLSVLITDSLKKSWDKLKMSLATNPFGWITMALSGLAALGTWMYEYAKAHDYAGKAAKETEKAIEEANMSMSREQRELSRLITAMETAEVESDKYTDARKELIAQFGKYDENLKTELDDVNNLNEVYQKLTASIKQSAGVRAYNKEMKELENQEDKYTEDFSKILTKRTNKLAGKDSSAAGTAYTIAESIANDYINKINNAVEAVEKAKSEEEKAEAQKNLDALIRATSKKSHTYQQRLDAISNDAQQQELHDLLGNGVMTSVYNDIFEYIEQRSSIATERIKAKKRFGITDSDIEDVLARDEVKKEDKAQGKNLKQVISELTAAERELEKARANRAKTGSDDFNGKKIEDYEQEISSLSKAYQQMTGNSWTAARQRSENYRKALEDAELSQLESQMNNEQDKYKRAEIQRQISIKKLEQERESYKKSNNGADDPAFQQKLNAIEEEYQRTLYSIEKEAIQFRRNIDEELSDINLDVEISGWSEAVEQAETYEQRVKAINGLRDAQLRKLERETQLTEKNALNQRFGEELMTAYNNGQKTYFDSVTKTEREITEETARQIEAAKNGYRELGELKKRQQQEQWDSEDYNEAYGEYRSLGEALGTYEAYSRKKEAINLKYDTLRGNANKALLKAQEKGDKERVEKLTKMIEVFNMSQEQEMVKLGAEFLNTLSNIKDRNGYNKTIGEVIDNKSLEESIRLVRNLRKAATSEVGENIVKKLSKQLGIGEEEVREILKDGNALNSVINEAEASLDNAFGSLANIDTGNGTVNNILSNVGNIRGAFKNLGDTLNDDNAPAIDKINAGISAVGGCAAVAGNAIMGMADMLHQLADASGDEELSQVADLVGGIAEWVSTTGQGAATGGWIGAVVAGVTDAMSQLTNAILSDVAAAHQAEMTMKAYKESLKELRYEEDLRGKDNIFGQDRRGNLVRAIKVIKDATDEYRKANEDFINESNIDEDKLIGLLNKREKMVDLLLFTGAFTGAPTDFAWLGSSIKNVNEELKQYKDTAFEALVGGFDLFDTTNITNYFKAIDKGYTSLEAMQIKTKDYKLKKDEYKSLKDLAPEVFDDDGKVVADRLQNFLAAYDSALTNEQKMLLNNLLTTQMAYDEALEQSLSYYADMFGNLGESIASSFEEAFRGGETAMDSFTKDLSKSVESWVSSIAYAAYIAPILEKAQSKIETVLKNNGSTEDVDAAMDDALSLVFDNLDSMQSGYNDYLEKARTKYAELYGMTLYEDIDAEGSKGFGQMTQDTAEALNARFTALQIEGANVVIAVQAMQLALEEMQTNVLGQSVTLTSLLANSNIALQYEQEKLDQLKIIAENTSLLAETNDRLNTIAQNTGRL